MKNIGLAFVLMIAACDNTSSPTEQMAEVRLLGINASGSARVRVAGLNLTIDGRAWPDQVTDKELDLGQLDQAWAAATFNLPADAHKVAINLQFQKAGTVVRNGKTQPLDLSGPPVNVMADATLMRPRSKVVLQLDLSRSLVDQGEQVFLLPDFIVLY
ncbi:MAG TPA: hypothetical protein VFF06_03910 [Polyangia bacterium]|nr:hypothetical protein [Polyangia bacterium]